MLEIVAVEKADGSGFGVAFTISGGRTAGIGRLGSSRSSSSLTGAWGENGLEPGEARPCSKRALYSVVCPT